MATQLKQTDFYTPTSPCANIRVAFSAGPAAIAMGEALAGLPEADRTLDEIAAWTVGVSAGMQAVLVEADQRHVAYNTYYQTTYKPAEADYEQAKGTSDEDSAMAAYDLTSDRFDSLVDLASDAQTAVCRYPAANAADLRAKLAFIKQHKMADGMNWTQELLADAERIAEVAVRTGAPDLPIAVRNETSDEEVIAEQTRNLISAAKALLSPAMYTAFLHWCEAASHFSSSYVADEEGERRCGITTKALKDVSSVPAANLHDYAFKAYLLALEVGDCSCFGPLVHTDMDGGESARALAAGTANDRVWMSTLPARIDQLSQSAWDASTTKGSFSIGIGTAITSAFTAAIQSDFNDRQMVWNGAEVPTGYDLFMRAPLIHWQHQYARYVEARDDLVAYERDVYTPTFADENVADDVAESVQARFDALLEIEHDAIKGLYRIPAPGPAELAIKLQIFERQSCWELAYAPEAIRQITIDARRHGYLGAHLETDAPLAEAFASRRRDFVTYEGVDLMGPAEDAYFFRLDEAESVLLRHRATTVEGVLAKLRVGFANGDPEAWSDQALSDPACAKFRDGLATSGLSERMTWSAIEDLARIAGVSLSEQGR